MGCIKTLPLGGGWRDEVVTGEGNTASVTYSPWIFRCCQSLPPLRGPHFCIDRNGGKSNQRGEGFRFPSPLWKPHSLKRPTEGVSRPPHWNSPQQLDGASVVREESQYGTGRAALVKPAAVSKARRYFLSQEGDPRGTALKSPPGVSFIQYFLHVQKVLAPGGTAGIGDNRKSRANTYCGIPLTRHSCHRR